MKIGSRCGSLRPRSRQPPSQTGQESFDLIRLSSCSYLVQDWVGIRHLAYLASPYTEQPVPLRPVAGFPDLRLLRGLCYPGKSPFRGQSHTALTKHVLAWFRSSTHPYARTRCPMSHSRATVFADAIRFRGRFPCVECRHVIQRSRQSRPRSIEGDALWRGVFGPNRDWTSSNQALTMPRGPCGACFPLAVCSPRFRQALFPLALSVTGEPDGPGHDYPSALLSAKGMTNQPTRRTQHITWSPAMNFIGSDLFVLLTTATASVTSGPANSQAVSSVANRR